MPKEQIKPEYILIDTPTILEQRKWIYDNFDVMYANSQETYTQFGDKTLINYLDKGRRAMTIINKPRADGRSNIKSVTPLNKLKAILASVALKRPGIVVQAINRFGNIDLKKGLVIKDLHTWSYENLEEENTADTDYFHKALDCQVDGTKITYEGYDGQTHTHKKIVSFDQDTGEVVSEDEEYKTDQCYSQDVRPEDFYVWNPYMRSLQRQPKVAWRSVYDKAKFDYEFRNFKNAKYVMTRAMVNDFGIDSDFFKTNTRVQNDQVEVIRMYDVFTDRMIIMANNVPLQDTPLTFKNGKPKKYPFAKTVASPFPGGEFFWGMNLWHIIEGDVSGLETLSNLGIEQEKIAVNPPTLTTSGNEMEDNMLLSGRVLEVDNINNFRELQFKSPDQAFFKFVEGFNFNIDSSTVDPVGSGQNVPNTTARGQVIAEENARKLLSLFNMMMENLVLQEAKLRIPNIIQFQLLPGAEIRVGDTQVGNETGTREIKVVDDMANAEPQSMTDMLEYIAEVNGIKLERLNITPSWLEGIKYSIKVLPESAYQQGKSLAIALELEKIGTVAKLFPQIFQSSSELFFRGLMEKYEDNPEKYIEAMQKSMNANQAMLQQGEKGNEMGDVSKDITGENEMSLAKLTGVES